MISHKHKFLFIHVPKTGGNAVQSVLKEYSENKIMTKRDQDGIDRFGVVDDANPLLRKHSTMRDYISVYEDDIKDYLKFVVIRNPFDKIVSHYFSPHRWVSKNPITKLVKHFSLRDKLKNFDVDAFSVWAAEIKPLEHYLQLEREGFGVDEILRFENLKRC